MPNHTDYENLWKMERLSSSERDFINSGNISALYQIAWEEDRISTHQRVNARNALRDEFLDAGMRFDDVFDYAQWKEDMGYADAKAA